MADADPKHVVQRRLVHMGVLFTLRSTAAKHGIPPADLGLVDYEVPNPQAASVRWRPAHGWWWACSA